MSVKYDMTAEALIGASYRPIHAGDDYDHRFTVTRNGVALPLTGAAKVWLTVKESSVEPDSQAKLQLSSDDSAQIEITDAAGGEFVVKFRGTGAKHTQDLEGKWLYDLQAKLDAPAETLITLAYGKVEFLPNLTRATS